MSDFQDLLAADRDAVFLNLDEFAISVTHLPLGNTSGESTVIAVVEQEKLQGTNEIDGDGVRPDTHKGTRIRESTVIQITAELAIDDRDRFIIAGKNVGVKRVLATDGVMQRVLVDRVIRGETKSIRPKYG